MADRSAGEQKFIEQMTRKKLVDWCDRVLHPENPFQDKRIALDPKDVYVQYAATRSSPFISDHNKTSGDYKILATGWAAAASFLKR